jgi:O-methyltransferase
MLILLKKAAGRVSRAVDALLGRPPKLPPSNDDADMEPAFHEIWRTCRPFTMTSKARGYGLFKAAEHLVRTGVAGDLVECGVWRGGSTMVMAMSMLHFGDASRTIHLFDTFNGMTRPTDLDRSAISGAPALGRWEAARRPDGGNDWGRADLDDVRTNLGLTRYPADRFRFYPGDVADTLPKAAMGDIALLRLDTDFYESTKIELETFYPRVVPGGFVVIDDYGHFTGARRAVDDYLASASETPFLSRLDYTGRLFQVPGQPAARPRT